MSDQLVTLRYNRDNTVTVLPPSPAKGKGSKRVPRWYDNYPPFTNMLSLLTALQVHRAIVYAVTFQPLVIPE